MRGNRSGCLNPRARTCAPLDHWFSIGIGAGIMSNGHHACTKTSINALCRMRAHVIVHSAIFLLQDAATRRMF